jgi:hypothetical protein
MKIYKELDDLGFFEWYCTQYGGLVYQEYKTVYDDLPLDNLIRTELNACVFKFFREKYGCCGYTNIHKQNDGSYVLNSFVNHNKITGVFILWEEVEFECIKEIIKIIKNI